MTSNAPVLLHATSREINEMLMQEALARARMREADR